MDKHFTNSIVKIYLVLAIAFISQLGYSQENKDCSSALVLCGDSPFELLTTGDIGLEEDDIQNSCLGSEYNSLWLEVEIIQAGYLTFVFRPNESMGDLDFAVFKAAASECQDKELIRCMASGISIGSNDTTQYVRCLGETGLRESEVDVEELPGCGNSDNNFLAPLVCEVGDIYYIVLNDFSGSLQSIELEFGGTAAINCITSNTIENKLDKEQVKIFPNPSNGFINYSLPKSYLGSTLSILNLNGQTLYSIENLTKSEGHILLPEISNGLVIVRVFNGSEFINIPIKLVH